MAVGRREGTVRAADFAAARAFLQMVQLDVPEGADLIMLVTLATTMFR